MRVILEEEVEKEITIGVRRAGVNSQNDGFFVNESFAKHFGEPNSSSCRKVQRLHKLEIQNGLSAIHQRNR